MNMQQKAASVAHADDDGAQHQVGLRDPRLWTEPFLLMSAPDDEQCTVAGCRTQSKTRWQVEVIGYQGRNEAPDSGPTFTACLSHLTQQMNRYLPMGGRR